MPVSSVGLAAGSFFGASPSISYIGNLYLNIVGILPILNGGTANTSVSGSNNLVLQTSPIIDNPTFNGLVTFNSGANIGSIAPSGSSLLFTGTAGVLLTVDSPVVSHSTSTNFQTSLTASSFTQTGGTNSISSLTYNGYTFAYTEGNLTLSTFTGSGGQTPSLSGGAHYCQIGNNITIRIQVISSYGGSGAGGTYYLNGFAFPAQDVWVMFYSANFSTYPNPIRGFLPAGTGAMKFYDNNFNPVQITGGNNYNMTGTVTFCMD